MACGGCSKRRAVLQGIIKNQAQQQRPVQSVGQRVAVVAHHLARDVKNVTYRSTLVTRKPR